MAVTVSYSIRRVPFAACPATLPAPAYFLCDTEAELPATIRVTGDTAFSTDTGKSWIFTGSVWVDISVASAVAWGAITGTLSSQSDLNTALGGKVPATRTVNAHPLSGDVTITKADVSLGNVDNTSDASKPVSTATQTALDNKQALTEKGAAFGYASLDATAKVPSAQLPTLSAAWGAISGTIGDQGDLTSALNAKAPLASPTLTGTPAAPTAAVGTNTTQLATTAYVRAAPIDTLGVPTDVTTLNASTSAHGLMQKYPGGTTTYLRADGSFAAPTAAAADQNPNLRVQAADYSLLANYSLIVSADYEVGSGFVLDLAADALLEVA